MQLKVAADAAASCARATAWKSSVADIKHTDRDTGATRRFFMPVTTPEMEPPGYSSTLRETSESAEWSTGSRVFGTWSCGSVVDSDYASFAACRTRDHAAVGRRGHRLFCTVRGAILLAANRQQQPQIHPADPEARIEFDSLQRASQEARRRWSRV